MPRHLVLSTALIRGHRFESETRLYYAVVEPVGAVFREFALCGSKENAEAVCAALNNEKPLEKPRDGGPLRPFLQFR